MRRWSFQLFFLPLVATLFSMSTSSPSQAQSLVPVGPEVQVNTFTTDGQQIPRITPDGSGGFVVVWRSTGADGDGTGIVGRRLDSTGQPVGDEFVVNFQTLGSQESPAVAAVDGHFAVVWQERHAVPQDPDRTIVMRLFDAANMPISGDIQVNTTTAGVQGEPSVAAQPGGGFVVVWQDDATPDDVRGRAFDGAGVPVADDFLVNSYTTGRQVDPEIVPDGAGMMVVWNTTSGNSPGNDTSGEAIVARRLDSLGQPVGTDFQVNSYTTGGQYVASVLADGVDGFVVAWTGNGMSGGGDYDATARRFDDAGSALGADFTLEATDNFAYPVRLAANGVGGFVVVWGDGSGSETAYGRQFDGAGNPVGTEFELASLGGGKDPEAASVAPGELVVVWESDFSSGSDTDQRSIQARRFAFDSDGDGTGDPVDLCTDLDEDGFGDPGFPANTCAEDNCSAEPNPIQDDEDLDGVGDVCDICSGDDATGDSDDDGVCDNQDLCLGDDATGDSDGDGLCADRDCNDADGTNACEIFKDGFESGDFGAWSESDWVRPRSKVKGSWRMKSKSLQARNR